MYATPPSSAGASARAQREGSAPSEVAVQITALTPSAKSGAYASGFVRSAEMSSRFGYSAGDLGRFVASTDSRCDTSGAT